MIIRKATDGEDNYVLSFYYDLIDQMRDREYRPSWTKGVYPTLEDIHAAIVKSELNLAVEDGVIAGAFILNHAQGNGYDRVQWTVNAAPDKVGVVHLLAVHPAIHGKGTGKALLRRAVELSRGQGDEVLRLDTLTRNLPGRKLYEGFGFRYCGDYDLTYPTTGTIPFSVFEWKHEH